MRLKNLLFACSFKFVITIALTTLFPTLTLCQDWLDILGKALKVAKWAKVAGVILSSDDDLEVYLHNQVVAQLNSNYRTYSSYWLSEIGQRLVTKSSRRNLPGNSEYSFTILDSRDFNAFAVPGGAIYVTKPLYELLDADEMAFVLGHEIGHIAYRHSVSMVKNDNSFYALKEIAKHALKSDEETKARLDLLVSVTYSAVQAGYSRQWESEVDIYGVNLAYAAGYNSSAAITALQKLGNATKAWGQKCFLWCTHPAIEDRIASVRTEIRSKGLHTVE